MRVCFWILFITLITACAQGGVYSQSEPSSGIYDFYGENEAVYLADEYAELKDEIGINADRALALLQEVEKRLEKKLAVLKERGNSLIPQVTLERILHNGGSLPQGVADKVRKRGVLIIKDIIPGQEVEQMHSDLVKYLYKNRIYPAEQENQTVYDIYWSRSQMQARSHPRMLIAQKSLLKLWHMTTNQTGEELDLEQPIMYIDRLRIQSPGSTHESHIPQVKGGGGIARWRDKQYRQVYRHILAGNLDAYDPFEVDYRVTATMKNRSNEQTSSIFKGFEGWLFLSKAGPDKGGLKVVPILKETTAFWFLRPFLPDVPRNLFPGCLPGHILSISKTFHRLLHDAAVALPEVTAGDAIFWHPDLIHCLEEYHSGSEASSALFIAASPDCALNRAYLRSMRHAFILGRSPPDFPESDSESSFEARCGLADLSLASARATMGFSTEAQKVQGLNQDSPGSRCNCSSLWP